MDIDHLNKKLLLFLEQLFEKLETAEIDVSSFLLDHVCWRCASQEEYRSMSNILTKHGSLFHKSIHNGREISLFQLDTSVNFQDRNIDLIELPAPKSNKPYASGYEHAEFVLDHALESWHKKYLLPWDIKNINKQINPDIKLKFDNISVKFHPYSLAHVVKHLEQNNGVSIK